MLFFIDTFVFAAAFLIISTCTASPDRRFHATPAQVTPNVLPTRIELRDVATTTAPNDGLATDICGWVGGDPGQPWVCAVPEFTCLVDPGVSAIGCCAGNDCPLFRTACFPLTASCGSACNSNGANLVCSETAAPLCATYSYPNSVTELRCVASAPSQLQIDYTYTGFTGTINLPRVLSGVAGTTAPGSFSVVNYGIQTPSTSSSQATSSSASTGSSSSSSTPGAPPPASTSGASSPSKSNAGAIAGGVVGGIAVLAVIGLLFFYYRRRSYNRDVQEMPGINMTRYNAVPPASPPLGKDPIQAPQAELQGQPRYHDTQPTEMQA
ncbi:uncharacterized protein LY89DRAFT_686843 [Mollisia scopiformis]|uniref:Mid2 domain-containing protein n=1 Tax=Mollisia scopiformis TaxID=149040 RepID=A0A194X2V7_MOLSC|nr:uncharacterized protein LY89DRAFT_686843 [Mollisia scopiformis]KUJ14359.1 hypothetical protein LY89DRAFT_686843 [Mollisia scopiformis]